MDCGYLLLLSAKGQRMKIEAEILSSLPKAQPFKRSADHPFPDHTDTSTKFYKHMTYT